MRNNSAGPCRYLEWRGEKRFTELGVKFLFESEGIVRRFREREDGTATAAHERIERFGLRAEPIFRHGQPWVFGEGGRFEVVAQGEVGEGATGRAGPRILRIGLVGPRRGDAEAGMDEQALVGAAQCDGIDDLAAAVADRRSAVDEEGDIAAEPRGKFGELGVLGLHAGKFPQREQDGCGVAAAAAEARTDRHRFFEMDAHAGLEAEFFEEDTRRPGGKIVLRVGKRRIGAGKLDAGGDDLDVEHVAE